MNLSLEQYYEVLSAIGEKVESVRRHDRRHDPRTPLLAGVVIAPVEDGVLGEERRATLCDLSTSGLSILIGSPMKKGTKFFVQLPSCEGKRQLVLFCVARHGTNDAKGRFQIGAELLGMGEGQMLDVADRFADAA